MQATVEVDNLVEDIDFSITVTRAKFEQMNMKEFRKTMEQRVDGRLEMLEDDLECLRVAVQDVVDDGERVGKKVGAHGDLIRQAVKDICRLRMQGEGASTGMGGAEEPVLPAGADCATR